MVLPSNTLPGRSISRTLTSLVISRPEFIEHMEKIFEADFEKFRLMRAGEYDDKSFWFRFAVRLSSLTAPIQ
jgi:hypothetical protein